MAMALSLSATRRPPSKAKQFVDQLQPIEEERRSISHCDEVCLQLLFFAATTAAKNNNINVHRKGGRLLLSFWLT